MLLKGTVISSCSLHCCLRACNWYFSTVVFFNIYADFCKLTLVEGEKP